MITFQQLWRSKLQCCKPGRVEQFSAAPATRHELCTFRASTENISIRELVNHGALWLFAVLRLRNTLTYLLYLTLVLCHFYHPHSYMQMFYYYVRMVNTAVTACSCGGGGSATSSPWQLENLGHATQFWPTAPQHYHSSYKKTLSEKYYIAGVSVRTYFPRVDVMNVFIDQLSIRIPGKQLIATLKNHITPLSDMQSS